MPRKVIATIPRFGFLAYSPPTKLGFARNVENK